MKKTGVRRTRSDVISGSEVAADDGLSRLYRDEYRPMLSLAARLHQIENPSAYLRTSVVNGTRRWHRRVRREDRWHPVDRSIAPTDGVADALAVRRVLAELPDDQREAVVLRFFADLSFREIGEMTDCPTQTAATRVRRGLERVRASLEDGS